MSDKFCCITWQELSTELHTAKDTEINNLMLTSSLPRSMFASVFKVLDGMANYCPVCGSVLNKALTPVAKEQHRQALDTANKNINEMPTTEKRLCRACAGKGTLGKDANNVEIKCMSCHGQKYKDTRHVAEDPKAKYAQSKVEDLREKTGIGDSIIKVEDN